MRTLVGLGDRLLQRTGSLKEAAALLRRARHKRLGNPLRGVLGDKVRRCLSREHFECVRELAEGGAAARRGAPRRRERAQ
eukprot:2359171-Pyramimonas_sp.AAC.1